MHIHRPAFAIAAGIALLAWACGSDNTVAATLPNTNITYKATLNGANERPTPITTAGTGTFTGTLVPATGIMTYTVSYSGLGSNSSLAHIHGPGTVDQAVGVIVNFASGGAPFTPGSTSGSFSGSILLTAANQIVAGTPGIKGDSLLKLMDLGLTYANIHTTTNGGGEIRGQIAKQP